MHELLQIKVNVWKLMFESQRLDHHYTSTNYCFQAGGSTANIISLYCDHGSKIWIFSGASSPNIFRSKSSFQFKCETDFANLKVLLPLI